MKPYPLINEMTEGLNKHVSPRGLVFQKLIDWFTEYERVDTNEFRPQRSNDDVYVFNSLNNDWHKFKNLSDGILYFVDKFIDYEYKGIEDLEDEDIDWEHIYDYLVRKISIFNKLGFIDLAEPSEKFKNFKPDFKLKYQEKEKAR